MVWFFWGRVQMYTHVHPYYSGLEGKQIHLHRLKHENGMSVLMSTSGALQPSLVNPECQEKKAIQQPTANVHQSPLSLPHWRLFVQSEVIVLIISKARYHRNMQIFMKVLFGTKRWNGAKGREREEVSRQ